MNLKSCENCGVVVDMENITPREMSEKEYDEMVEKNENDHVLDFDVICGLNDIDSVDVFECPVCVLNKHLGEKE